MEALINIKRKNNRHSVNSFPLLRFKKFQMNVDDSGVHIRLSANFLKADNHRVRVQDGMLHLKIKHPKSAHSFYGNSFAAETAERDTDLEIRLPDKRHQKINSVRFKNGILQVHLVDKNNVNNPEKSVQPPFRSNRLIAS